MRIAYGISFEDFLSLQRPFTLRAGRNPGFVGALVVCVLMASLGVLMIVQGLGPVAGLCIVGLGVLAAVAAWFFEKRAVARAQKKYEENQAVAFQEIHCRDHRTFEADENSFTTTCNCGTVTRPWSELIRVSDAKAFLMLGTKKGLELVPKAAFSSEGDLTEFRSFMLERLNDGHPLPVQQFEIDFRQADVRSAYWLHVWNAGGWRNLALIIVRVWGIAVIIYFLLTEMKGSKVSEGTACLLAIGGALLLFHVPAMLKRPRPVLRSVRIHYDQQGLYVENSGSRIRYIWSQFIGYLENKNVFLLYINPRQYKIIPKGALANRMDEFSELLRTSVQLHDYKNKFAGVTTSHRPTAADNRNS